VHDCREILSAISAYMDGEVSAELRRALEGHLRGCESCSAAYDSTRKTLTLLIGTRAFELSPDFTRDLLRLIEERGAGGRGGDDSTGS